MEPLPAKSRPIAMRREQPKSPTDVPLLITGRFSTRLRPLVLLLSAVGVLTVPIACTSMAASTPAQVAKAGIPFTVLDTHGWTVWGGPVAATSLTELLPLMGQDGHQDLQAACPADGCLVGSVAPAHTLLIAFSPSNTICNKTKKITAELSSPRELTITTGLTSACDDSHNGAGSRPPAPDLLLAIPLNELPTNGSVTILTPDSTYTGSGATTVRLG